MTVRAQYVGTRGYDLTYQMHVNGYQTVCEGCFAPYPYGEAAGSRASATSPSSCRMRTSRYNGLQLTLQRRPSAGLSWIVNYTRSHSQDEVSNGGFLPFAAGALLSPLPGELARNFGNADYDIRHNLTASYTYELPLHASRSWLAALVNGWQVSETFFWHTGVPFTVQSAPYTANGNGIINGGGPQFASLVPGVPLYTTTPIPGVTPPGTLQWLNPDAFVSTRGSEHRAPAGRRLARDVSVRDAWSQYGPRAAVLLERPLRDQTDCRAKRTTMRAELQVFNLFNHANFALPTSIAGIPGEPSTQTGFGALDLHDVTANGVAGCRARW